jgi:hypothetical protein
MFYAMEKTRRKFNWNSLVELTCIHPGHLPYAICQTLSETTTYASENQTHLRTAPSWAIKRRVVVIPYRRFRATYRSHLKGPICCPETS